MEKKNSSIWIDEAVLEHARNNPSIKSLSDWVNNTYQNEFMSIEKEQKIKGKLLVNQKKCEERIELLQKNEQKLELFLPKMAKLWIKNEGFPRSRRFPVKNIYKYFIKKFKLKITYRQFNIFLRKAEEEIESERQIQTIQN